MEVGQVWTNGPHQWKITRILTEKKLSYGINITSRQPKEGEFGYLLEDGTPAGWGGIWSLVAPKPEPVIVSFSPCKPVNLFEFFKSVPTGNCACNIPRGQCWIHKDSPV